MAVPVKVVRQQTPPKPSETLELSAGANRNPPEPSELASGTYTSTHRNPLEPSGTCLRNLHHHTRDFPEPSGTCLRSLHQHTPEPSGTFRNLPPEPTPAHAGTMRKLHQHSGTFQNLPPEPTPAHTGTLRNLPEPSHTPEPSGTFRNLPPEPAPATRTGTHRSLSGLKTPLAYAVGEKVQRLQRMHLGDPAQLLYLFHLRRGLPLPMKDLKGVNKIELLEVVRNFQKLPKKPETKAT